MWPAFRLLGTPSGIRTRDLHLERVTSWAARLWGHRCRAKSTVRVRVLSMNPAERGASKTCIGGYRPEDRSVRVAAGALPVDPVRVAAGHPGGTRPADRPRHEGDRASE